MELSVLNVLELLAGFQAFLFAFYLIFKKDGKQLSNYLIAIFIMLLAYNVLDFFADFIFNRWSENITPFLQMFIYLAAPALYFHIKTSLFSNYKFQRIDLLHFIPYLLVTGIVIWLVFLEYFRGDVPESVELILGYFFYFMLYAQTFFYLYLSYRQLSKHKEIFFENYSSSNTQRYAYIKSLIILVGVLYFLSMINIITRWVFDFESFSFISYAVIVLILILFCWFTILGLRSPELFVDEAEAQTTVKKLLKLGENDSSLKSNSENNELANRLNNYMKEEEPFLDASLSLHTLARETNISSRELSILINHHLNKHFFDFINEYRIEKAKDLLTSPERKNHTVLEILFEVGFNSKSSFNTSFKKLTGLTPTAYRKKNALKAA